MKHVAGLVVVFAILSPCGYAVCGEPQPRLVCAEYFRSKVVATAKVIRTKTVLDDDGLLTATVYFMQTEKILRGSIDPEFRIYESNDSGRAAFEWTPGSSYVLFLYYFSGQNDGWLLDGCGNSGPSIQRESVLTQVGGFARQRGGAIQVAVGTNTISNPAKNVRVNVKGGGRDYQAETGSNGQANIKVPAGQYSIQVPGYRMFELSFEDPTKVTIENGSCAQLQFVKADKAQ